MTDEHYDAADSWFARNLPGLYWDGWRLGLVFACIGVVTWVSGYLAVGILDGTLLALAVLAVVAVVRYMWWFFGDAD